MLRDLLGDDPSAKLEIKQGRDGLFVPGLTEIQVNDVDELNEVGITAILVCQSCIMNKFCHISLVEGRVISIAFI